MSANDIQVGGTHYKSTYNHWDFVTTVGLDYFQGQITRYISRWRKKNGLEDLQKAAHYLNKYMEIVESTDTTKPDLSGEILTQIDLEVSRFKTANGLDLIETEICYVVTIWRNLEQLQMARGLIKVLIDQATPVPLEDSNRHAERGTNGL